MKKELFYFFGSKGYLTTIAVTSLIFEQALIDEPFDERGLRIGDRHNIYDYLQSGEFPDWLSFPVEFVIYDGKYFRDMIDIRYDGHTVLISDRMKEVLLSNGLTGWTTYPIKLTDRKGKEVLGYNGFSIIGSGGESTNKEEILSIPNMWERIHARMKYNTNQWDGSDFFIIDKAKTCITHRCYEVLKNNKITAIDIEPFSNKADIIDDKTLP